MKTRIIQTRFYKDNDVMKLTLYAQHLFLYLLTSEHINISGIFELPDMYIQLESKLTPRQLEDAKQELSSLNKVQFYNGWVFVVNAEKNNGYRNSPSNETAYQKELQRIPEEVKQYFDSSVDSTVGTTPDSNNKQEIINNKQETINNKYDDQFLNFWETYPRKIGKGKAYSSWKKVKSEHDQIMEGLENQLPVIRKQEMQYIPHPTTWLNGRRWEDEISESVQPKRKQEVFDAELGRWITPD